MVSVSVLIVLCVSAALFIIPGVLGSCPSGWTPYACGSTCVRKFVREKTWSEARASCRNQGAELVTITNWEESNFMKGFLRSHHGRDWWTAANKHHGYWRWAGLTTSSLSYSDWGPVEPNNPSWQEVCATVSWHWSGRWNDDPCHLRHSYLCEKY